MHCSGRRHYPSRPSGVGWSGMEWSGAEWSGAEQSGVESRRSQVAGWSARRSIRPHSNGSFSDIGSSGLVWSGQVWVIKTYIEFIYFFLKNTDKFFKQKEGRKFGCLFIYFRKKHKSLPSPSPNNSQTLLDLASLVLELKKQLLSPAECAFQSSSCFQTS